MIDGSTLKISIDTSKYYILNIDVNMDKFDKIRLFLEAYKSGIKPVVINLFEGYPIQNAEHTSDDKAFVGGSWKQYWKLFAQEDFPDKCPFCGYPLNENDIDGCHVLLGKNIPGNGVSYNRKKFIIPGHHTCNMQLGKEFQSKVSVKAVEAIER